MGVGKHGDMLLNGRFQCGMKEDVVWGCAIPVQAQNSGQS